MELIWAVLLHDTGKPETQETPERNGVDRIHFRGHAKKSAEIAKFILSLEKEPKRYRKMGLNEKGEKIKGFNYTEEFVSRVEWLVKNHMLCKDFSNMKETKQIEFMKNPNFRDLLRMWKIDAMSEEVEMNTASKMNNYSDYYSVLEIYKNFEKEIESNENNPMFEKQKIITSEEIMDLLREKGVEVNRDGFCQIGEFRHAKLIGFLFEYIDYLYRNEKSIETKKQAEQEIEKLHLRGFLSKISKNIGKDRKIIDIKKELSSSKNKKEERILYKELKGRSQEIFDSMIKERLE